MKKVLVFMLTLLTLMAVFSTAVMAAPLQGTDELEGYEKQWNRGNDNVAPNPVGDDNKKFFYDDLTGFMRGSFQAQPDWIGYEVAAGSTVKATALYWPNEPIKGDDDHFAFYTSADGKAWDKLPATSKIEMNTLEEGGDVKDLNQRKWDLVTYTTSEVPAGHQYIKIEWPGDGDNVTLTQPWGQRLHSVTVTAAKAAEKPAAETKADETKTTDAPASNPKTSDPGIAFAFVTLAFSACGLVAAKSMKKK